MSGEVKTAIARKFTLEAAHRLPHVPPGHKCGRVHGHSWRIEVWIAGVPDSRGWFMDFADVDSAYAEHVHALLDHQLLNDHIDNPTTENLCVFIALRLRMYLPGLFKIVAHEGSRGIVEVLVS